MFPFWYGFAWQEPWGPVLFRLPSFAVKRYLRYYPAIRLPAPLLTSFLFGCTVIPRVPFREKTGSPQLTWCHCNTWLALETPQRCTKSCHDDKPTCWLPLFQQRRPSGFIFISVPDRLTALYPIHLRLACFITSANRRLLPMVWLVPYRAGVPPAKHHTLSWAHWKINTLAHKKGINHLLVV